MTELSQGFTGSYRYTVDSKNRVSIPSKLRKEMPKEANDTFIIISDKDDRCIKLYPSNVFKNIVDTISKANPFHPLNAYLRRRLLSNTYEAEMDGQNRIKLPPELLKKTNINGVCLIVGVGDYIELWDPDEFDKYLQESSQQFQGDFGELLASVMNANK
ncbi:MAG: division/cell wall cluster transcriptional repressor MraZ [Ignavibacteria bacterium]|nr:division/cell wall cluster transcriptional repressor MraZ [Ignavibacteria bacterium]